MRARALFALGHAGAAREDLEFAEILVPARLEEAKALRRALEAQAAPR